VILEVAAIDLNRHGRSVNGRYHTSLTAVSDVSFPDPISALHER
jgi:hypothetical protein